MIHQINVIIHISAGTIALFLGIVILARHKGTRLHVKAGKIFIGLLGVVVFTGFTGWLFFRSNAFLLMLTILAGYNTYGGYRIIQLKMTKAKIVDQMISVFTLIIALSYCFWLMGSETSWMPAVIYPTVGALVLVTGYDIVKSVFVHEQLKRFWLYEHIYKLISAFSALFSAFSGTVLPNFKPYSQVGPSVLCMVLIIIFIFGQSRKRRRIVEGDLTAQQRKYEQSVVQL